MREACPNCKVRIEQSVWRNKPQTFLIDSPWPVMFELWTGTCTNCRFEIRSLFNSVNLSPTVWTTSWEKDPNHVVQRWKSTESRRLERLPVNLFWCWSPLLENHHWANRIVDKVAEVAAQKDRACVLIVPSGGPIDPVIYWPDIPGVDGVWCVNKSAILDQYGPYPCVETELAIKAALKRIAGPAAKFDGIYHCWPSAMLSVDKYIPLGSDEDLAHGWAVESRRHLKWQVNDGAK